MGIKTNGNGPHRGNPHYAGNTALRVRGRYASMIVGPAVGLTVMYAQAQTVEPSSAASNAAPVAASAAAAPAKSVPNSATDSDATTLSTVQVTANRRREPAREVPMQVTAMSAKELQQKGDQSMRDYLKDQVGVSMVSAAEGAGSQQISIRGVTTGADISPTVGVYVDDVPFGSSTFWGGGAELALDMGLLDLNHIEILRGPQGTLYGAGAMGGLLKYVTNEPDSEDGISGHAGAALSGTEHGTLNHTEDAVVNVPIKEGVAAFRVSAFNQQDGGYINRIGSDPENGVNETDTRGGRASLIVTPTRDLTIRLTATQQQIKSDGSAQVDYDFTTRQPIFGDLTQGREVNEPYDQLIGLYSADIEYDFGWARLNAISAYQTIRTSYVMDYSSTYDPILNAELGGPVVTKTPFYDSLSTDKFTQELRLTSPAKQDLEWIAGLFYTNERSNNNQALIGEGLGTPLNLESAELPSTYREYSTYGDLTYHVTSRLAATVGLRVAHNEQTFEQNGSGVLIGPPSSASSQSSDTSKTYLFTLNYLLAQNSSVYARIATGYRPGGPQASLLDPVTGKMSSPSFNHDTLTSYEVGYKADFLDKRGSVSIDAFDVQWKDIQLLDVVDGISVIANGGTAQSKGIEFFGSLNPTSQWHLSTSLAYTDARLTEDAPGIGALTGERLPNVAPFSATANLDYLFGIGSYRAYVGATESYVGKRNAGFDNSPSLPNYPMPGYFSTDLRAGIDLRVANVSFFVHNLFNRGGMQSVSNTFLAIGGPAEVTFIQPLTVGMQVDVPF